MSRRYRVDHGIVIRRTVLPSGDVVATLLSETGKWRGIARKGKKLGGSHGRLSLFHDVTVQHYRRRDDDLALVTQVELNGALPRLSDPAVYPYAHLLAELADRLTVDVHLGEPFYAYLASGLRGLHAHHDPEAVALAYAWRLLAQAGLAPEVRRCVGCGRADGLASFDVARGGMACDACGGGTPLSPEVRASLTDLIARPLSAALDVPVPSRESLWRIFGRYAAYHVAPLASLRDAGVAVDGRSFDGG